MPRCSPRTCAVKARYLPAGGAALQFCSISEGQQRGSACSAAPWLCLEPGASLRELSVVVLLCEAALAAAPAISQGQPRARSLPLPVPSALGVALRAEGPGSLLLPPAGRDGAGWSGAGAGAPAAPAARSSLRRRHVPVPGRLAGAGRSPQPGSLSGRPAPAPRYGWGGDMGRDGTGQVRRALGPLVRGPLAASPPEAGGGWCSSQPRFMGAAVAVCAERVV